MSTERELYTIKDFDIERSIISLLVEEIDIRSNMTDYYITENLFSNEIAKKIFRIVLKSIQEWKELDYLILKELIAWEVDEEALEDFFTFNKFRPKKDLFWSYVKVLWRNFKRNELVNLTGDLKKSALNHDDQGIANIKKLLEEFDFSVEDEDNPEIWLVWNDFLADWVIELINSKWTVDKSVVYTWYRSLDEWFWGFEKWNFVIIAARPSVWKSVAMINLSESMKKVWAKVLFFSWEMYAKYVLRRIISINLWIDWDKLKFPSKLNEKERKLIVEFVNELRTDTSRHIYYSPKMCALDIYQHAKNIKKKYWLDAIIVDYLWKMYPNNWNMNRSRNEIVSDISRELYELAWALDVVVITWSQLNREWAKTMADWLYVPKLTDLRDSWSLEQDADIIIWISRDKEAAKHCILESDFTDFTFSVIKNRNWKMWDYTMNFYPTTWRLTDRYEVFAKDNPEDWVKKSKSEENKELINNLISSDVSADSIVDDIFWNE